MPSARRLLTLGGAAFVGLAATALFAAPANATSAKVSGTVDCGTKDGYTISWTVTGDVHYKNIVLTINDVQTDPDTPLSEDLNGKKLKGDQSRTVTQVVSKDTDEANLSFHPEWSNGHKVNRYSGSVDVAGKCEGHKPPECKGDKPGGDKGKGHGKPCTPPCKPEKPGDGKPGDKCKGHPKPCESASASPSPSASSGGGGGGGETTPTPSRSAQPSLPVTGSQAAIYGGGAAVLLGAGAGLFFLARRRRISFEA